MNGEELEMLKSNLVSSSRPAPPAPDNASAEDLRRRMLDYLAAHNSMTIASCHQNVPWAAAVFFVNDQFDLYFLTNPHSRHGSNMAANTVVSAAIHEDYHDWGQIRGIQLEGRAELVRSAKVKLRFWSLYEKKFPFVEGFFRPGRLHQIVQSKLAGIRLYRIVPRAVWYLDNNRGFGHREYLPLAEAEAVSD